MKKYNRNTAKILCSELRCLGTILPWVESFVLSALSTHIFTNVAKVSEYQLIQLSYRDGLPSSVFSLGRNNLYQRIINPDSPKQIPLLSTKGDLHPQRLCSEWCEYLTEKMVYQLETKLYDIVLTGASRE